MKHLVLIFPGESLTAEQLLEKGQMMMSRMQKSKDIRSKRKLQLSTRAWTVGIWFNLEDVNYWFRFWLFSGTHNYSFFRRLRFWLHECWGIGWDIRKSWSSEYNIRIFYLELCIEFKQKRGSSSSISSEIRFTPVSGTGIYPWEKDMSQLEK